MINIIPINMLLCYHPPTLYLTYQRWRLRLVILVVGSALADRYGVQVRQPCCRQGRYRIGWVIDGVQVRQPCCRQGRYRIGWVTEDVQVR